MSLDERRQHAESYRKAGSYTEAVTLLTELWGDEADCTDGARLLHCLRKLEQVKEARALADHLYDKCLSHPWVRLETIWAYDLAISRAPEETPLSDIIGLAERVLSLKPDPLPLSRSVFAVLKRAKTGGKWGIVQEWVDRLSPDSISDEPMVFEGREGWSRRGIWYNYKVNAELEVGNYSSAESLGRLAAELFPKQGKFFQRLHAKALCSLGNLDEGLNIYGRLCRNPKADWWLRHEYAYFLKKSGQIQKAMTEMSQAALMAPKLPHMVTLLFDLGSIFIELGDKETAAAHFSLAREIREKEGWSIPNELQAQLHDLTFPAENALAACRKAWQTNATTEQRGERSFSGSVTGLFPNRTFCFIKADDGVSIFTPVALLASSITAGSRVRGRAIRSYDKKKDKEGWKAVHVESEY